MAIAWARWARLLTGGVPVDDATLGRVADAVTDEVAEPQERRVDRAGGLRARLYLTAEEREDEFPDGVYDAVREYLDRRPELDGGIGLGWRDGRWTLFVGIVGDLRGHRARLTRIGGERVVVGPRRRTDADLEALEDRVRADEPALTTANLSVVRMKTDRWRGVVEVHLVGAADQRDAAAAFLAARYGDAVAVRWPGPDRFLEALHPFASWISEGRRRRVFFALDRNGQQRGNAGVAQETDEQIVIALSRLEPVQDSRTVVGGFSACHADLELREPVGARAVIDPSAGVVRPSLADLRSRPDRCWPPPAGAGRGAPAGTVAPLHMRVSDLELGPRARGLLSHRGVRRVDDLLRLSAEQVAALPNMNQKTFDEIVDALAARRPALTWWATDSRSPRVLLKRRPSRTPRTEPDALDPSPGVARPDALPVGRRPHQ